MLALTSPMRRLQVFATVMVVGSSAVSSAAWSQDLSTYPSIRPRLERMIRDTTLANGLTVIVAENHTSPVTTVEVVVRTGAFTQIGGDEGISHVFEHVLFRAFGDHDRWGSEVSRLNALSNGVTTAEYVAYYITTPSEGTESAAELLADLVVEPKFRGGDIESEMKIVIGEYERSASEPTFTLRDRSERMLWGTAWSRKDPLGTPVSIQAISKNRLREVYDRYYVPNNAAVIISGDVSPAQAFAWVEKHFRKWRAGPDPFATAIAPIAPLSAPALSIIAAPVDQITIKVLWHGPSARTAVRESYVADVFSDMLNASISGFQERLAGSGLFQDIEVYYHTQNHTGPISISGVTTVHRAEQALQALHDEIARFDDAEYLTQELLDIAIKRRAVRTEFGFERGSSLAHTLASTWSIAGLDYFLGYVDNMRTVRLDELKTYVTRYISGRPFAAAALVPEKYTSRIDPYVIAAFGSGVIQ